MRWLTWVGIVTWALGGGGCTEVASPAADDRGTSDASASPDAGSSAACEVAADCIGGLPTLACEELRCVDADHARVSLIKLPREEESNPGCGRQAQILRVRP